MSLFKTIRVLLRMPLLAWREMQLNLDWLYRRAFWREQGLILQSNVWFHYEHKNQLRIGRLISIGHYSVVVVCSNQQTKAQPLLTIGQNVYIGDHANIRAAGGAIHIGDNVLIANNVTIVSSNHGTRLGVPIRLQDWELGDITIEEDVWIGAGVIVLPGATIRKGAVIAAGAVVRGEVSSDTIYGGIPAKPIKRREQPLQAKHD